MASLIRSFPTGSSGGPDGFQPLYLVELMDTPALVAEAERITQHNAEKFSMDRIFARHLEVYREVAGA